MKSPYCSAVCCFKQSTEQTDTSSGNVGDGRTSYRVWRTVIAAMPQTHTYGRLSGLYSWSHAISPIPIGENFQINHIWKKAEQPARIVPNTANLVLYIIYYITYNIYVWYVEKVTLNSAVERWRDLLSASVNVRPSSLVLSSFRFVQPFSLQRYRGPQPCKWISRKIVPAAFRDLCQIGYSVKFYWKFLGVGRLSASLRYRKEKDSSETKSMTTDKERTHGRLDKKKQKRKDLSSLSRYLSKVRS